MCDSGGPPKAIGQQRKEGVGSLATGGGGARGPEYVCEPGGCLPQDSLQGLPCPVKFRDSIQWFHLCSPRTTAPTWLRDRAMSGPRLQRG